MTAKARVTVRAFAFSDDHVKFCLLCYNVTMNVKSLMKDVLNKQLAHAFVIARREGFNLCVRTIDGLNVNDGQTVCDPQKTIDVIVNKGFVKKSWEHSG